MGSQNLNGESADNDVFMRYVQQRSLNNSSTWKLIKSKLGGRGLCAARPLAEGEIIFQEAYLLCGPRVDSNRAVCAGCFCPLPKTLLCSKACGVYACSGKCENSVVHARECSVLSKARIANVRERLALVAALRSLALPLEDREVVKYLERHQRPEHKKLLQYVEAFLNVDELTCVQATLEALDATAFEAPCGAEGTGSLRALYPLGAIMNHECSPNTRHSYDEQGRMTVETTRDIAEGEELTTTYTSLTWGNQARQMHLTVTKKFLCNCRRCADPTEFGANLMALYCMKKLCGGVILPLAPKLDVPWGCASCGSMLPSMKMDILQTMVRNELKNLGTTNPEKLCRILRKNALVPGSNQAAIDFKFQIVKIYGHEKGFLWSDLTMEDLELKRLMCIELLTLLSLLRLGKCRPRGLLLLELILTLNEMRKCGCETPEAEVFKMMPQYFSVESLFNEAALILRYDYSAAKLLKEAETCVG